MQVNDDQDFFGKIGDIFSGVFDTAERVYEKWLNLEMLNRFGTQTTQPAGYAQPVATAANPTAQPATGPFYGVPVEVMVLVAGAALVGLVLLRR